MQVVPSYGVSQGSKGAAASVARSVVPVPGVPTPSKLSNLDATGLRVVKRGCVVEFPGGATGRVSRVRLGFFWTGLGLVTYRPHPCRAVRVVS